MILSHGFWQRVFGGDPGVVGTEHHGEWRRGGQRPDKNQFTVAGVLGPEFLLNAEIMPTVASIRQMDIFLPLPLGADAVTRRGDENYNLMGRLKDGRHDGAGACGRRRDRRTDPRQGQAGSHLHHRRRSAARSGRRQRPPRGAGAARIGDAGAADRLRERGQPAADARDRAAEGGRDPHRARRGLAAAGAPAADRERAARDPRWRRRAC